MTETWTIKRMLTWSEGFLSRRGSGSPRLDAELLLAEVLGLPRLQLYLQFDRPLMSAELAAYKALIKRRALHEPVAYILGRKAFHGVEVEVGPEVLVPRPETEWLVDRALAFLADGAPEGPVLDLCTGSGAIALALAHALRERGDHRPIVATDISDAALGRARASASALDLQEAVQWRRGDLFAPLGPAERFAVIVSNPPYVRRETLGTLDPDVRDWEPALALDGGPDGMEQLRRIAASGGAHLVAGGLLAVELGSPEQGEAIVRALGARDLPDARFEPIGPGPTGIVSALRAGTPAALEAAAV